MNELLISDSVTNVVIEYNQKSIPNNPAISYLLRLQSDKSKKTMRSCLTAVVRLFGSDDPLTFNWSTMSRDAVQLVIQRLLKTGKSPNSINLILCAIKGVAEEARFSRLIDSDTFQDIKGIKRVKGVRLGKGRMLSPDEMKLIFEYLDESPTAITIRDGAMISLMVGCGLRRSEVAELEYSNIDFQAYSIKITGKGNKERENYMPDETYNRLKLWIDTVRGDHDGPLFNRIRKNGDVTDAKITTNGIGFVIEKISVKLNMKPYTPHDLRRTYASMLLENGEDLLTVKDALGHSSVITTQKYDKRGLQRLKTAARNLKLINH